MKKIIVREYGSTDVLDEIDEAIPTITETQILIKTVATSVNDIDIVLRKKGFPSTSPMRINLPHTLGIEFSGIITKVGSKVSKFAVGDHVLGLATNGSYAEYLAVDESAIVIKAAKELDLLPLGGLTVTSITAWSAVILSGKVQPNQRVLIHGAAGGVGSIAVQLAKLSGAYVIATASAGSQEYLKTLGVDEFIDYQNDDFTQLTHDIDLVIHTVDKDTQERSYEVLKKGGKLISTSIIPDQVKAKQYNVEAKFIRGDTRRETLTEILDLYVNKKLLQHIDRVYPFSLAGVKSAHKDFEEGPNRGKKIISFEPKNDKIKSNL